MLMALWAQPNNLKRFSVIVMVAMRPAWHEASTALGRADYFARLNRHIEFDLSAALVGVSLLPAVHLSPHCCATGAKSVLATSPGMALATGWRMKGAMVFGNLRRGQRLAAPPAFEWAPEPVLIQNGVRRRIHGTNLLVRFDPSAHPCTFREASCFCVTLPRRRQFLSPAFPIRGT
jgi:hypothetical protein